MSAAIDLAAALEAVRLGEATGEHAAVLAEALQLRDGDLRVERHALSATCEQRDQTVAALAAVRAERDHLLAVVVAQADARAALDATEENSREEDLAEIAWRDATEATEALAMELRDDL